MAGLVLTWAFDRSAPDFASDVDAFTQALSRLQAEQGFAAFVPLVRESGSELVVSVLPASLEAPAGKAQPLAADELGKRVRDGRLGSDRVQVKRAATAPLPQVDLDNIQL
jgi:hypothetical protein